MGLDQYMLSCEAGFGQAEPDKTGEAAAPLTVEEAYEAYHDAPIVAYWRKEPNLEGWMSNLAVMKGIVKYPDAFNCTYLPLNIAELELLRNDLKENSLPETEGFFFGRSSLEDDGPEKEHTMMAIDKAIKETNDGRQVVYYSSW